MNDSGTHPLETILRQCAQATPNPWYPSVYADATGTPRERLDPFLDQLRLGGLIRLTPWEQGTGQGYVLTPGGKEVLENPRHLERLRAGELERRLSSKPAPADLRGRQGTAWDRGEAIREALLGEYTPVVTYALIAINVMVFAAGYWLASVRHVSTRDYLSGGDRTREVAHIQELTGALRGSDVYVRGQWWRLLTACFGHIGVIHLATNMISLFMVGPLLERIWGPGRFLLLYLLAGFGGSCGMLIENPLGGGAGASGALWGVLASLATWLFLNRHVLAPTLMAHWRRQLLMVFLLNLFITFGVPNISKGGHFGGGIVGLLAAVPLDYLQFGSSRQRLLAVAGLIAIPVVGIAAVLVSFRYTGEELGYYDLHNEQFVPTFNGALQFYRGQAEPLLAPNAPRADRAELSRVVDGLAKHEAQLTNLADRVDRAGPYQNPEFERDRREMRSELRSLSRKLDEAQKTLRRQLDHPG